MEFRIPNKLFVGGFSMDITKDTLRDHFSSYGEIEESKIIIDKVTGLSKGFGFITFTNPAMAAKALEDEHLILGRKVDVSYAIQKVDRNQEKWNGLIDGNRNNCNKNDVNKNKIFVGGLHPHLTNADLKAYFESYGTVEDAFVVVNKTNGRSRCFGFVTFESEETFETVLKVKSHVLKGNQVELKRAEPRVPPQNTMEPSASSYGYDNKFYKVCNAYDLPFCWSPCAVAFYYPNWYYPYGSPIYYGYATVNGSNTPLMYDDSSIGTSHGGLDH
ncbi:hypothetical protein SLE2022_300500 [Rubroshorea leprosula]